MILTRRQALEFGGGSLAVLLAATAVPALAETLDIGMEGNAGGSHVWFDPVGLLVQPGQTVRWINRDPGNSHTVTAYHPSLFDRPLRIPAGADPFHSDYLLPGESFSAVFTVKGVYEYYCVPHEHAGMVGRFVVGSPQPGQPVAAGGDGLPEAALRGLPPVEEILSKGRVRRPE